MPDYVAAHHRRTEILETIKQIDEVTAEDLMHLLKLRETKQLRTAVMHDLNLFGQRGWIKSDRPIRYHGRKWSITEAGMKVEVVPFYLESKTGKDTDPGVLTSVNPPGPEIHTHTLDPMDRVIELAERIKEYKKLLQEATDELRGLLE